MNTQIEYPEITFWDKEAKKIDFINPEDFRREKLLKILGLNQSELQDSFGVAERDEIVRRQRLIKFFIDNPNLIKFFVNHDLDVTHLPECNQNFLDYFNPEQKHNPFWQLVNDLIKNVSECQDIPQEILSLMEFFKKTKIDLETKERETIDNIAKEIQKSIRLEGVVKYNINIGFDGKIQDIEEENSESYGYKRYSFGLSNRAKESIVPLWLQKRVYKLTGVNFIVKAIVNSRNKHKQKLTYAPCIIEKTPDIILKTITQFFKAKLTEIQLPEMSKDNQVFIHVFFRYSVDGLEVKLLNVNVETKQEKHSTQYIQKDFPGYSNKELKKITINNYRFNLRVNRLEKDSLNYAMAGAVNESISNIGSGVVIKSKSVDQGYKWFTAYTLYSHPLFRDSVKLIKEYRNYIYEHMEILRNISLIADLFIKKSKEWNKPLCFPEILEKDRHLVSFETLEPIHLIGETKLGSDKVLASKDLVSIVSLPSLNGQMIGFTGQNAGGKSATEEAIVNLIFSAQSGFPVFGKGVSLNIKRQVGMVFLERGSGSTCELLLRKTKTLLESLNATDQNGIILVLDEVGTGTQEIDGLGYSKKLLKKLADSHCSTIFSSQIIGLAEYAEEELNAECFTFDLQHQIKPGIGKGGLEKLMAEVGIDSLLN